MLQAVDTEFELAADWISSIVILRNFHLFILEGGIDGVDEMMLAAITYREVERDKYKERNP